MVISIGSNISSLQAQRALGKSAANLSSSFEKLSSGQRINKASDDAAGLSIAASLESSRRVYTQSIRNLNDGISLTSVASGALDQLTVILTRQKELATQAANGSYSSTQRQALNQEASALTAEYNRLISTTSFNHINILDLSTTNFALQAGYGTQELLNASIGSNLSSLTADGTFSTGSTFALVTSNNPLKILSADFNNDGTSDVLSVTGAGVGVAIGNSDGSFKSPTMYASFTIYDAALGDFNNDGNVDVATFCNDGNIRIFSGVGNGTFAGPSVIATGTVTPGDGDVGDFNNDGVLDLAIGGATTFGVLLGNSNGTFKASSVYTVSPVLDGLTIGDLNNDGYDDIVSATRSNSIQVYIANSNGTFNAGTNILGAVNFGAPAPVYLRDVNNDNILDYILSEGAGAIDIGIGVGNGTFKAAVTYGVDASSLSLAFGDFNADSQLDIAASGVNGHVNLFLGNSNGTFKARTTYNAGASGWGIVSLDVTRDGISDLLIANSSSTTGTILVGGGTSSNLYSGITLTSQASARSALDTVDRMLLKISNEKSALGAFESRLRVAISNLQTTTQNYEGARSRIMDVDVAEEVGKLTLANIVQQSAIAILGTANQQPQLALQLLRG